MSGLTYEKVAQGLQAMVLAFKDCGAEPSDVRRALQEMLTGDPARTAGQERLWALLSRMNDVATIVDADGDSHHAAQLLREAARRLQERWSRAGSAPYGIVDPDYARIFTVARALAWNEGYAIAMQGSFTRDLDLVALPWTDQAREPEHLVRRIADACDLRDVSGNPGKKPHGRLAWSLMFKGFGDPRYVDLSIFPRAAAQTAN
jgi:hypothetical protein